MGLEKKLRFKTLENGQALLLDLQQRSTYVIREQKALETLWTRTCCANLPMPIPLPSIDFSKEMVLAAYSGPKTGTGHYVEITDILERDADVIVNVVETEEKSTALFRIFPYYIIKVKNVEKPILFKFSQETKEIL